MDCRNTLPFSNFRRNICYFAYIKLYIIITTLSVVVSSELFHSLVQNPGKDVNFYEGVQNDPANGGSNAENSLSGFTGHGGEKASVDFNCGKNSFYQDPGISCEILNPIECDYSYPYRKYDGSCNNPNISRLGMANQCYLRFTPPYYEGLGDFRKSVKGGPLPEPRDISLKIFKDHHIPTVNVTFQFATFGQFVAFDLVHSIHPSMDECCSEEYAKKPECKPISVRSNDPFYSQFNKTCIGFRRTEQCACNTACRAQKNGATSAIDLSHLYSVSEDTAKDIRALDGTGRLKFNDTSVGCLLPSGKDPSDPFCPKQQESECFKGGDPRVNQHTSLTSLITIFMREHNRVATILKKLNQQWGEEKLFQESRKIVIAEFQIIVFRDYLPILVSPLKVKEFGMRVPDGSNGIRYDPSVILGMWNEFAIGSYRLHSFVPRSIGSLGLRFKDTYSNPFLIRQGHLSQIIKGSQKVPSEKFDRYMVKDVTDFLYKMPGMQYGQDLAAINVQRGRDHGLAPYVDVVKFCSNGEILISSFDELHKLGLMTPENADLLKRIYAAVEDVDMWVGMQLENHMPGAPTGPSTVCINIKQFFFNQKGDRFYFDIIGPEAPFTSAQRKALKQSSLGRILCDNTDITQITKNPFLLRSNENPVISCNDIPEIDLMLWKDSTNNANVS